MIFPPTTNVRHSPSLWSISMYVWPNQQHLGISECACMYSQLWFLSPGSRTCIPESLCSFYYYIIWDQFVCDEFACYWSCRKCPSCCDMVQVLNRLYLGSYCVRLILRRPNVHVMTEAIKVFQNLFKVTSSQAIIVFPSPEANKRHLGKIKNHLTHR